MPESNMWLEAEVPPAGPEAPLRGSLTAGGRATLLSPGEGPAGLSWNLTPVLRAAPDAAEAQHDALSPDLGAAVTNDLALPITQGLRLLAQGRAGDRLGLGLGAPNAEGTDLGLTLQGRLEMQADFVQLAGLPLRLNLAVATERDLVGYELAGPRNPQAPYACDVTVEVTAFTRAPLNVKLPCEGPGEGRSVTFGLRTQF